MRPNRVCFWTAANEPETVSHSRWEKEGISRTGNRRISDALILVPIGLYAASAEALEIAIGIARKANGKLLLVHAIALNLAEFGPANPIRLKEDERGKMERELVECVALSEKAGVPASYLIAEGSVPEVICGVARQQRPALIVMNSRKVGRLGKLVSRRTVDNVVKAANCPVLVLQPNK